MKKLVNWIFGIRPSSLAVSAERRSLPSDFLDPLRSELPPGVTIGRVSLPERNSEVIMGYIGLMLGHAEKLGLHTALRSSGRSKFVIGYIAGVVDAICQQGDIFDEPTRLGMLELAYQALFLEGNQSSALDNFLKLQNSDKEVKFGQLSGGQDAIDFFDDEIVTFIQLYKYLAKEYEKSSSLQTAQKQR
jgi:hypothetical protein